MGSSASVMKLYSKTLSLSFLALVLAKPKANNDGEQITKNGLKRAIEDFTQKFYVHLATTLRNENFVFSPLSLHSALSMVYLGSKTDSKTFIELRNSLGILTAPNVLKESYKKYIKFLLTQDTVKFGNHIWLKEGYEIDMMQLTSKTIKYDKFDLPQKAGSFEAIKIPYDSEKFDLKIILPVKDLRLLEDFTNLTFIRDADNFNLFRETGRKFKGEVNLKMPPFKVTSKVQAKEVFQKLDVKQLFTESAELDLITDKKPIGISGISHESVIQVNVNGTEGAAATGVEIVFFSASPKGEKEVVVDRPFIFVLEDKIDKIPLLVGRVVDPLK